MVNQVVTYTTGTIHFGLALINQLAASITRTKLGLALVNQLVTYIRRDLCPYLPNILTVFTTQSRLFNDLGRRLWKILWEKEKMLVTSIISFFHIVFYPIKEIIIILRTLILSSANAFNLDQAKILSFGKVLTL